MGDEARQRSRRDDVGPRQIYRRQAELRFRARAEFEDLIDDLTEGNQYANDRVMEIDGEVEFTLQTQQNRNSTKYIILLVK